MGHQKIDKISSNVSPDLSRTAEFRFALAVEYDGSSYHGWQSQKSPAINTVQDELERALSKVANQPIRLICAGRTDAGVHAKAQIVHFVCDCKREEGAWVKGGNSFVSKNISVLWARHVEQDFHARFSAQSRQYRYLIYNNPVRPALMKGLVTPHFTALDESRMQLGADFLLGEHDFTSLRGVACQSKTAMRNVHSLKIKRYGDYLVIDIEANAFLLHMVRNIVGILLEVGEGRRKPKWVEEVLMAKDRSCAGITAAPDGLYLTCVSYPEKYKLPVLERAKQFLML